MRKKLKILMIAATPIPGNRGTPSRILEMSEALKDLGHDVRIVAYHLKSREYNGPVEVYRIPNIKTYRKLGPGPSIQKFLVCDPLLYLKVKQLLKTFKPDIIHGHSFEGALVGIMLKRNFEGKLVYDAHSTLIGEMPHYNFLSPKIILNAIDKYVPQKSDVIISVSEEIKSFLINLGISEKKIYVIPTGVNINQFNFSDGENFKKKYNLKNNSIVTYTGTLAKFQGTEYFVRSIPLLLKKIPDLTAVIVGNDPDDIYKNLIRELYIEKNVLLLENTSFSDVPEILAASDVVVSPRIECPGIPQKITNYMAAGKAIVSFEGSAKLIVDNENGLIVENGNIAKFAEAIIKIIRDADLKNKLGKNSYLTIKDEYEWSILAKKIEQIYFN